MHPEADLDKLMAAYQQGDSAAAAALIHRLSPQLHRFFLVQQMSRPDADDLLQETWLRIHEARHTYRTGEPALPWVYAIARHIRVDHYRKALRVAIRERQVDAMPEAAAEPRAQIGAQIGAEHGAGAGGSAGRGPDLAALLSELPRSQREVIAMLKISGMSLEEVARATSCSIGSVKQKAHRAYEKLRRVLIELGFGPVGDKTAAGGGPKKDAAKDRGARDRP